MGNLSVYIILGAVLFALGLVGFLTRRNLIIMFLCTELMFQGVILNLVGYSAGWSLDPHRALQGQAFAVFLIVVAAAEAALALGLVVILYRRRATLDSESWTGLWG